MNIDDFPLVSIIITSFNRAEMIKKCIQSALNQDYENIEIIISDNNSTDNSDEIIKSYCKISPQIKYSRNEVNIGMLLNFKKATVELSKGSLVTYISSDDYLINRSFITEAVNKFKECSNLIVYSGVSKNLYLKSEIPQHNNSYDYKFKNKLFDKVVDGKTIFTQFQYAHLLNLGGSVFFRSSIIKLELFKEFNTTFADLQVILLLALKGDFYLSSKACYVQTIHDGNITFQYANAEKAVLNLSFAEIPYEIARQENIFESEQLKNWYHNILKPFVVHYMIELIKKDKIDYQKFVKVILIKHPDIYLSIAKDKKWQCLKVVFNNKLLLKFYNIYKSLKNA